MSKSKHSFGDFCEGVLIGGSIAAMATFFLGNAKGKKLRKEWMHKYKSHLQHFRHSMGKAAKSPMAKKIRSIAKTVAKTDSARKLKQAIKHKLKPRKKR